jgi:hypothetical protein
MLLGQTEILRPKTVQLKFGLVPLTSRPRKRFRAYEINGIKQLSLVGADEDNGPARNRLGRPIEEKPPGTDLASGPSS